MEHTYFQYTRGLTIIYNEVIFNLPQNYSNYLQTSFKIEELKNPTVMFIFMPLHANSVFLTFLKLKCQIKVFYFLANMIRALTFAL